MQEYCTWKYSHVQLMAWKTSCGRSWSFGRSAEGFIYCPFCGKIIQTTNTLNEWSETHSGTWYSSDMVPKQVVEGYSETVLGYPYKYEEVTAYYDFIINKWSRPIKFWQYLPEPSDEMETFLYVE